MKRTGVILAAVLTLVGLSGCGDRPAYATDDRGVALEPQDRSSEGKVWGEYLDINPDNNNFLGGRDGLIKQMKDQCALMIEQDSGDLVLIGMLMEYDANANPSDNYPILQYLATMQLTTRNYCPDMMDEVTEAIQEGEARLREA